MSSLRRNFGRRLRQLRVRRGMTQAKLAEAVDVSEDLIGMIERGITAPSFETLEALARALDVPMPRLFDFSPRQSRSNRRGK